MSAFDIVGSPSDYPGFAYQKGDGSSEMQALTLFATLHRIPRGFFGKGEEVPPGWIPSGGVPWCSEVLGRTIVPDYYPDFLTGWLHRKVWQQDKWPLDRHVFIKPADKHKRFTGFVTSGTYRGKKKGPYWCSEIVRFENEWRYYVADGKVLGGFWYYGDARGTPSAPEISIPWPEGWCGTADFGLFPDGRLALVEAHPPFAAGWYGKLNEGAMYAYWLARGWKWLNR